MTLLELLILLVIAAICGSLGQALAGTARGGILAAIVLGFIGAALGTWIARSLELPEFLVIRVGDAAFPIVWAVLGSALFVALLSFLTRPPSRE